MKFKKINESVGVESKLRGAIDPTYARAIKTRATNKKRADGSMKVAKRNTDAANRPLLKREGLSKRVGKKRSLKEDNWGNELRTFKEVTYDMFKNVILKLSDAYTDGISIDENVISRAVDEVVNDTLNYNNIDTLILGADYEVIDIWKLSRELYPKVYADIYSDVMRYAKKNKLIDEDDDLDEAKKSNNRKSKLTEGNGDFYGVKGVEFIWRGQQDPLVKYKGKFYNYYDLEDWLWADFNEDVEEGNITIGANEDKEDVFRKWVSKNSGLVYSALYDLSPYKGFNEGRLVEKPIMDLRPNYDGRKSFYGKAIVDTGDRNNKNKLYSYGTLVAEIKEDGKPIVYGTYSQTTLRHIKEWLKQNGFKAETSAQIMADYGVR